ncbi:MAG: cytochrome c oxidase subunit II [Rhodobacterales bacterium]|nr:cytochrome c oxidase subunit II [Rhodobacterales bacterium]MDX5413006.1 cytochrome c oxidase subunit II [Rhodobacterales bacterium]
MDSALDIFGSQSWLRPSGVGAAAAFDLTWAMTLGFGIVFVIMMILIAVAWRAQARFPRHWWIWTGGIAVPLVAVALVLGGSTVALVAMTRAYDDALVIDVTGHQYWWDVVYDPDGAAIREANELVLPLDRPVTLRLHAEDVIHSFWVPSLSGKMDMVPGRVNTLTVTATETGIFRGQCAEFCGVSHPRMAFEVRVLEGDAFDAWLEDGAGEARDAARPELLDGREVFAQQGCAACHEIRGVAEGGRLGPDLTRVGGRSSLGAGMWRMNQGTLAGWIANVRDMKPGAQMPNFNHLSGPELRAVSAYLASLK